MNLAYQWLRGDGARGVLAVSKERDCHGRLKEIAKYIMVSVSLFFWPVYYSHVLFIFCFQSEPISYNFSVMLGSLELGRKQKPSYVQLYL